ncbi:MAG: hypothetical protein DMF77_22185, partial [Acidobacteria bacterium]
MQYGRIEEAYTLKWEWVDPRDLGDYGWAGSEGCAPDDQGQDTAGPVPKTPEQKTPGPPRDTHPEP